MNQSESKIDKSHIIAMLSACISEWQDEKKTGTFILSLNFCDGGFRDVKMIREEHCKKMEIIEKFSLQSRKLVVGEF